MSAREWKAGDVALAKYDGEEPKRFIYVARSDLGCWQSSEGTVSKRFQEAEWHRPLVVIDPEDREQIERLRDALGRPFGELAYSTVRGALRSLLAPPRPDEPTGLGAVVEDADGHQYLRCARPAGGADWQAIDEPAGDRRYWREVPAVRVLSEGVTA